MMRSWQTDASPEAHKMNGRVLHDIDVAPRMQACTGWLGGGSNQNTRRQERDPFPDLAEMKKARSPPESGRHRAAGLSRN